MAGQTQFVPKSREQITKEVLDNQQANYRQAGTELSVIKGSEAEMKAAGFALPAAEIQYNAAELRKQILPDTATGEFLDRHAFAVGTQRKLASQSRVSWAIQGTPNAVVTFGDAYVRSQSGIQFVPTVPGVTILNTGFAVVAMLSTTGGSDTVMAPNATGQWSNTPVNVLSLAVVLTTEVSGRDDETDDELAARVIALRSEGPGDGNESNFERNALKCPDVKSVMVYHHMRPDLGDALGCVTLIPLGAPVGDVPVSSGKTRVITQTRCNEIRDFFEGTRDAAGEPVTGVMLRPVGMAGDNLSVLQAGGQALTIDITVKVDPLFASPVGTHALVSATTTTVVIAGDHEDYAGQTVQLSISTTHARGGYAVVEIVSAVFGGVNTTLTFAALPQAPTNDALGVCVRPAPANIFELRAAAFAHLDRLTPGPGAFVRYPTPDQAPADFVRLAFETDIMPKRNDRGTLTSGVAGVKDLTWNSPGGNVTQNFGDIFSQVTSILRIRQTV